LLNCSAAKAGSLKTTTGAFSEKDPVLEGRTEKQCSGLIIPLAVAVPLGAGTCQTLIISNLPTILEVAVMVPILQPRD
jgi:hypothetical protein